VDAVNSSREPDSTTAAELGKALIRMIFQMIAWNWRHA
jgi:hypothetical protein